jgi:hypothetical protein
MTSRNCSEGGNFSAISLRKYDFLERISNINNKPIDTTFILIMATILIALKLQG